MPKNKIAVLGDKDSILGFKALGVSIFPVVSATEAGDVLRQVSADGYATVFIVEHLAVEMTEIIAKVQQASLPAIVVIPGHRGNMGTAMARLKSLMEKAVGVDILFKGESDDNE